jgi:hypothetical protein
MAAFIDLCNQPVWKPATEAALYAALQKLDAHDLLAGAPEMAKLLRQMMKQNRASGEVCEVWLGHWLDVDPAGALGYLGSSRLLEDLPDPQSFPIDAVTVGFNVLALRQPQWAHDYLGAMKTGPRRSLGVRELLRGAAQQVPAQAARWFAELARGPDRPAALEGYLSGLAVADSEAAFRLAAAEPAGPLRESLIGICLQGAGAQSLAKASALLDQIDNSSERRRLAARALDSALMESTENPLPWIEAETARMGGSYQGDPWANRAAGCVEFQPALAAPLADWALSLTDDSRGEFLSSIVSRLSIHAGTTGLEEWISRHAAEFTAADVKNMAFAITNLADKDPATAAAWAESLPAGPLRTQMQFQIALAAGSGGDFAQAAALYRAVAANDTSGDWASRIVANLGVIDDAATADWVAQLPAGTARTSAIGTLLAGWGQMDAGAAADWLRQLPAGPDHDAGARAFSRGAGYADPVTASEWVEQVADAKVRAQAAEDLFWVWTREDPAAARVWLRGLAGVDETWRKKILRLAQ